MTRLLLIRHAPTHETGKRLIGRLDGHPLSQEGHRAASDLAGRIADQPLRAVYASPLERTWATATTLAESHRLDPIRHDGLVEIDYGDWEGRTLKSLHRLKAWRQLHLSPSRFAFPNGEAIAAVQARAVAACEEVAVSHRRGVVALVSHADVIKLILSHYLGQPLDLYQRLTVSSPSVSVISLPSKGVPVVTAVNTNGDPATW